LDSVSHSSLVLAFSLDVGCTGGVETGIVDESTGNHPTLPAQSGFAGSSITASAWSGLAAGHTVTVVGPLVVLFPGLNATSIELGASVVAG
jgi:hypothetical protein